VRADSRTLRGVSWCCGVCPGRYSDHQLTGWFDLSPVGSSGRWIQVLHGKVYLEEDRVRVMEIQCFNIHLYSTLIYREYKKFCAKHRSCYIM